MHRPAVQPSAVVRLPDLVRIAAFHVAGPARHFDEATKSGIPQLWPALTAALPFAGQVASWATYGIVSSAGQPGGRFLYMAGVGVEPGCVPPPGFSTLEIPAASYAVFRITLDGTALHPQVKQAMAAIWDEWIPAAGLKVVEGPRFEHYDGRFDPQQPGSFIDFHVPVAS